MDSLKLSIRTSPDQLQRIALKGPLRLQLHLKFFRRRNQQLHPDNLLCLTDRLGRPRTNATCRRYDIDNPRVPGDEYQQLTQFSTQNLIVQDRS